MNLQIMTADVFAFTVVICDPFPIPAKRPVAFLFPATHILQLPMDAPGLQTLDAKTGLLRATLNKVDAAMSVTVPDFRKWHPVGTDWGDKKNRKTINVPVKLSGDALLARDSALGGRSHVLKVGTLRCPAGPVFKMLPNPKPVTPGSLLASLWPTLSVDGADLDYVLAPQGLCLSGALCREDASDLLRLPQRADDLAWAGGVDAENYFAFWDWAKKPGRPNPKLSTGLASEIAPTPWAIGDTPWAVRRWQILTPGRQPVLDRAFNRAFVGSPGLRLERFQSAGPATPETGEGALLVHLSAPHTATRMKLVHNAGLCFGTGPVLAHMQWRTDQRSSVMTANLAIATWQLSNGFGSDVEWTGWTARTGLDAAKTPTGTPPPPGLSIEWDVTGAKPTVLTLAPTDMFYAGLVDVSGNVVAGRKVRPNWLATSDGLLQVFSQALDAAAPDEIREAANTPSQEFVGGVPLDSLGGPPGLTAWIADVSRPADVPAAILHIRQGRARLAVHKPIMTWRTPVWWVALRDTAQGDDAPMVSGQPLPLEIRQAALPGLQARLRQAFDSGFGKPPVTPADASGCLRSTLENVFSGTYWVGCVGTGATDAWKLSVASAGVEFALPGSLRKHVKAWSRFDNAYFVRTVPEPDETSTGALLNPLRALFPASPIRSTDPVALQLEAGRLPRYRQQPFRAPGIAGVGWTRDDVPGFHPHIVGLSLEGDDPQGGKQILRHGIQMHLERLLRITADGASANVPAMVPLRTARPDDDVAAPELGKVATFQVDGWLPRPGRVTVTLTETQLGGDRPRLEFRIAGRTDTFYLGAYAGADGLGAAAWVAPPTSGGMPTLVAPGTAGAQPMLNSGQPLMPVSSTQTLDGAGRIQGLFNGEEHLQEPLDPASAMPPSFTLARPARLGWRGLPTSTIIFNVVDSDRNACATAKWDLSGEVCEGLSSRPAIGPCALVPRDLLAFDSQQAQLLVKLAPPWTAPAGAQLDDSPALTLEWTNTENGWVESLAGKALVWRFDSTGTGLRLQTLHLQLNGRPQELVANVTQADLYTDALGRVTVVPDQASPLRWTEADAGGTVECRLKSTTGGLSVDITLTGRPSPSGCAWEIKVVEPFRWGTADGTRIILVGGEQIELHGLRVGGVLPPVSIRSARASDNSWLISAANEKMALAGSLVATTAANASTQIAITCEVKTTQANPAQLLHACDRSRSWLVAVVDVKWASTDVAAAPVRMPKVGGRLVFRNDFSFRLPDGTPWQDEVDCVFDGVPCTLAENGRLAWAGKPSLLATHRIGPANSTPCVEFPTVHRFESNAGSLACTSLLLLTACADAAPAYEAQVIYSKDKALGVATIDPPEHALKGLVLRLPVRSGGAPCEVQVPAAEAPSLEWFPIVAWDSLPSTHIEDAWHERRALAPYLGAEALGALGQAQRPAHFAGGTSWPQVNEVLPEWAQLLHIGRWPRSGMLAQDGGVFPLPWRGTEMDKDAVRLLEQSSSPAVQVGLFAVAPDPTSGVCLLARGLISGTETFTEPTRAIADWARGEVTRRRHRSSALAIVRGRNELGMLISRPLAAQAALKTSDEPVGTALTAPPHSLAIDFLLGAETPDLNDAARFHAPLAACLEDGAIVEAVHALPRVAGNESATEFRLVLNAVLTARSWGRTTRFGLDRRQAIRFESMEATDATFPQWMPSLHVADWRDVIAPPLVDATLWSYRPGDSIWTQWSASASASSAGPGVRIRLRAPRASHSAPATGGAHRGERFELAEVASASVGGADWRLRQITKTRSIGRPYSGAFKSLLTLAVPSGVLHCVDPDTIMVTGEPAPLPLTRASGEATGYLLLDPLIAGVFVTLGRPDDEWGLAIVHGGLESVDPLPDVSTVLDPAGSWKTPDAAKAVMIHNFGTVQQLSSHKPEQPGDYMRAPAQELAHLLAKTPRVLGSPACPFIHWIHLKPRLALWIRQPGSTKVTLIPRFEILWIDAALNDQTSQVCAVGGTSVSGFAAMDGGPNEIGLSRSLQFEHWQRNYVLEWPSQLGATMAWHFEPSGACSASTKL